MEYPPSALGGFITNLTVFCFSFFSCEKRSYLESLRGSWTYSCHLVANKCEGLLL